MLNNSKEVQLPILEEEAIVPSADTPSALLLSVLKHQEEHRFQMWLQSRMKRVCSFMFKKDSFSGGNIATRDLLQSVLQVSAHTPQKKRFYCINVSEEDGTYSYMDSQLNSYFTFAVTPVNAWKTLCQMILLSIMYSLAVFIKHVCCRLRKWHSLPTEFDLSKSVLAFLCKHKFRRWILKKTNIRYILWFFWGNDPRNHIGSLPRAL